MKKYNLYKLSAWIIVLFSSLAMEKAFSQENQTRDKKETTGSVSAKPGETSSYVTGITSGRAKSLVGTAAGLISLIFGWRAKLRSKRNNGSGQTGALVALAVGLISIVLSVIHLSASYGAAFGSGSGKAGAIVALVFALIGVTLGGIAFRRSADKFD